MTSIGTHALYYEFDEFDYEKIALSVVKIYGVKGSEAEKYANENGFRFNDMNVTYTYGDVNNDESIDIADALMIARYDAGMIGLDETQVAAGDVNGDDQTDIADALMIARYDAGLITEF